MVNYDVVGAARLLPDPYDDWQRRIVKTRDTTRPPGQGWAAVTVEMKPVAADGGKTDHLDWLFRQVGGGGGGDDGPLAGAAKPSQGLHMTFMERVRLAEAIETLSNADAGTDVRPARFQIFLNEQDIYENAALTDQYEAFRILHASRPLKGLDTSLLRDAEASLRTEGYINGGLDDDQERKVIVAVIDDSLGFANARFTMNAVGHDGLRETRFAHLWLQDLPLAMPAAGEEPRPMVAFGQHFSRDDINQAFADCVEAETGVINEMQVYRRLRGKVPGADAEAPFMDARMASHGTHVLDIASGFDPAHPEAKKHPLLGVERPRSVTQDTSGRTLATYALAGLRQIMAWAEEIDLEKELPLVVVFSYGFQAGAKDGSTHLEEEIDRLVTERRAKGGETHIVLPAGNSFQDRTHARMQLDVAQTEVLEWVILPDDQTESFVEVWLPFDAGERTFPLSVEIQPPAQMSR